MQLMAEDIPQDGSDQEDEDKRQRIVVNEDGKKPFEVIMPPNRLKKKMGEKGGKGFDKGVIEKAERAVRDLARDYINNLIYDVQELKKAFDVFIDSSGQERHLAYKRLDWHAHELKGQGASFGYPYVTRVARSLCFYLHKLEEQEEEGIENVFTDLTYEILRAHVITLLYIGETRIRGDGGETGSLVVEGLKVAVDKHLSRDPKFLKSNVAQYLKKLQEHMESAEEGDEV